VFGRTVERLTKRFPDLRVIVPTVQNVADRVETAVAGWPAKPIVLRGPAEKFDAFAASNAALAASGTVALELAMARVPMVIGYRLWGPTYWAVRRAAKIKFANLINLLLDRLVVPELLQSDCTPDRLEAAVAGLLTDVEARSIQLAGFAQALSRIGFGTELPSQRAAEKILALVAERAAERA